MTAAAYVEEARIWARALEEFTAHGTTLEDARRKLARQYGIPARLFWSLRHRPPKQIPADLYHQLREAYLSQCKRLVASAWNDIAVLKAQRGQDASPDIASLELEASRLVDAIKTARGRA
jgi:hypothetical protein